MTWDNIWYKYKEYKNNYLLEIKYKSLRKQAEKKKNKVGEKTKKEVENILKQTKPYWNPPKYKLELNKNTHIEPGRLDDPNKDSYKQVATTLWSNNDIRTKFNNDGNIDIIDFFRWDIKDKSYHASNTVIDQFNLVYPDKNLKDYLKKITINTIIEDKAQNIIKSWFKNWKTNEYMWHEFLNKSDLGKSVNWILKKTFNEDNVENKISHFVVRNMNPNAQTMNQALDTYSVEIFLKR